MWSIPADLLQEHRKLSLEECSQPEGHVPLGGGSHISDPAYEIFPLLLITVDSCEAAME